MTPDLDALIAAARTVREHAYAPYSHFHVGAAVQAADGTVFTGANVENASYGLTICAERAAVCAAVAAGARQIVAVAVVAGESAPTAPCGACRQVLAEFGPAMAVVLASANPALPPVHTTLADLLPLAFTSIPEA
jgi:cytidine deaminase